MRIAICREPHGRTRCSESSPSTGAPPAKGSISSGADVADDEVPREPDPGERDSRPPSHLHVDDRQQDRQAAAALEDDVEHGVARLVVALGVAGEAVTPAEQRGTRARLRLGGPVRGGHGVGELGAERVEARHRGGRVDRAELGREGERDRVERRVGQRGERGERGRLLHRRIVSRAGVATEGLKTFVRRGTAGSGPKSRRTRAEAAA
jgi:hypothetical protein